MIQQRWRLGTKRGDKHKYVADLSQLLGPIQQTRVNLPMQSCQSYYRKISLRVIMLRHISL